MSVTPGLTQLYVVGDVIIGAALAGIGGMYREMPGLETAGLDDPRFPALVLGLLDRSEISHEALNRVPVPVTKTAFAKARARARKTGRPFFMIQLRRSEEGALHATPYDPDPAGPGLQPTADERQIEGMAALSRMITAHSGHQ